MGWLPAECSPERIPTRHGVLAIGNVSVPLWCIAGNRQLPRREADVLSLRQRPHLRLEAG